MTETDPRRDTARVAAVILATMAVGVCMPTDGLAALVGIVGTFVLSRELNRHGITF